MKITITMELDMSDNTLEALTKTGSLSQFGNDPFSAYGAKVSIGHQFLTFKNGEYLYGQNANVLPLKTRLAANMPGLRVGWRRWWGSQVEDRTVRLIDGQPPEPRSELGDLDESLWERNDTGQPRDPWQMSNILELVDAEGQSYLYTTSSKGGIGAIGRLCEQYGKLYRQRPGKTPIVELSNNFYIHPQYGKTYVPEFPIVDWAADGVLTEIKTAEAQPAKPVTPSPGNKAPRF